MYQLSILATTDTHGYVSLYDYFLNQPQHNNGLILAGSKIKQIKEENNKKDIATLVVDNGDFLQGSIMTDYAAERQEKHPIIQMMNAFNYDASTFGNHEFNYGLEFLESKMKEATFDFVNCNVKHVNGDYLAEPYKIIKKKFKDATEVTIGITGVVPEEILLWDFEHLNQKVIVENMYDSLHYTANELKTKGCDIVIALMHTGMDTNDLNRLNGENLVYRLAQISALDAFVFGHTHQSFPGPDYQNIPSVNSETGQIFHAYGVQPVSFSSHLGEIKLSFEKTDTGFKIVSGQSVVHDLKGTEPLSELIKLNAPFHHSVIEYTKQPIGKSKVDIESYFSQIGPSYAVEIIAKSGLHWFNQYIQQNQIQLNSKAIIPTSAPLKAGRDGIYDYVDIKKGLITLKDAISIYRFPNKLSAVNVPGYILKEWIEWSVSVFNQYEDDLIIKENKSTSPGFPSYNMDIFYGLTYTIDLSKEERYSNTGELISDSERIVSIKYEGQEIDSNDVYTVLTNDYRINFCPILKDESVVKLQIEDVEVRSCLIDYIKDYGINFKPTLPFTFTKNDTYKMISSPNAVTHSNITPTGNMYGDYMIYNVDMNRRPND